MDWRILIIGFSIILAIMVDVRTTANSNDTWDEKIREKKARLVKKLKKDLRKLKKQEGAVKLVGGENGGHEGNDSSSSQVSKSKHFFFFLFRVARSIPRILKLIFSKNNFLTSLKSFQKIDVYLFCAKT